MKRTYLCYEEGREVGRLSLLSSPNDTPHECGYRISPIFPFNLDAPIPSLAGKTTIAFVFCPHAFSAIGQLKIKFGTKETSNGTPYTSHIWYTSGLASLVLIASDASIISEALHILTGRYVVAEIWQVDDHVVQVQKPIWAAEPGSVSLELQDYSELSNDSILILDEMRHCLSTAMTRCTVYAPEYIEVFRSIREIANHIIRRLKLIEKVLRPSTTINSSESDVKRKAARNMLHRITGDIIEINAALSYVNSQWFSGCAPILSSECQIRSNSLLGVGSAFQALVSFCFFVTKIFEVEAIDTKVKSFDSRTIFDIFKQPPHDAKVWENLGIDRIEKPATEPLRHLLVHFSARRGFRESPHCVTVPIQSLNLGATSRWGLLTLSHELMHAHVRGILAALFPKLSGETQFGLADNKVSVMGIREFTDIYNAYCSYPEVLPDQPHSRRLCMQMALLHYALRRDAMKEAIEPNTANSKKQALIPEDIDDALHLFEDAHRDTNEVIAHVLDFVYFYDEDDETYVHQVWSSWCEVPAVLENVNEYVLRTLYILSVSNRHLSTKARFEAALARAIILLKDMPDWENIPLLAEAIRILCDKNQKRALHLEFDPKTYLVDLTLMFMQSKKIKGELLCDERFLEDQDQPLGLPIGSFSDHDITSPVSFIISILRSRATSNLDDIDDEMTTAWMLLTCGSAIMPTGVGGNRNECSNVLSGTRSDTQ